MQLSERFQFAFVVNVTREVAKIVLIICYIRAALWMYSEGSIIILSRE